MVLASVNLALGADFIKVDTSTRQFIDATGRARLFHGVNVVSLVHCMSGTGNCAIQVFKSTPFHPTNGSFDPRFSLNQQDVNFLVENGFNVVRLYVAWQGVEVSRGIYNTTYLSVG